MDFDATACTPDIINCKQSGTNEVDVKALLDLQKLLILFASQYHIQN